MIYRIERASLALILVGVAVLFWGGIEFATAALLRCSRMPFRSAPTGILFRSRSAKGCHCGR